MTKNELLEAIRNSGAETNSRQTKDELQIIYDGLHVHQKPEPEEEVEVEVERKPEEKEVEVEKEPEVEVEKEPEPEPSKDEFDELLGKIKGADIPHPKEKTEKPLIEKTRKKRSRKESSPDSFRMEGYVLLLIVDTIFPFTFAFLNNIIDKKIKVEMTELQLCDKDFNKLEPLADQAADYMSVNLNPIAGFLLISTFMYANNLISVRMQIEKK